MKNLFKSLFKKKERCPKCGSSQLDTSQWHRAWNLLCTQASGAKGTRCYDCGYIQWELTPQEFVQQAIDTNTTFISLPYDHPDFIDSTITIEDYLKNLK